MENDPIIIPVLGTRFSNFNQGFYSYEGDLLYLKKEQHEIRAYSFAKGGNAGKGVYSKLDNHFSEDFDLGLLEPEDPYDFLRKKMNILFNFINTYGKKDKK